MLSEVKCSPLSNFASNVTVSSYKMVLGKIWKDILLIMVTLLNVKTLKCNIYKIFNIEMCYCKYLILAQSPEKLLRTKGGSSHFY